MSYCRFSSDNWQCDLYVYESHHGIAVHVAASRRVGEIPEVGDILTTETGEWNRQYRAQMDALESLPLAPIGGPYDGRSFYGLGHREAVDLLISLKVARYRFPVSVLDALLEEAEALEAQGALDTP